MGHFFDSNVASVLLIINPRRLLWDFGNSSPVHPRFGAENVALGELALAFGWPFKSEPLLQTLALICRSLFGSEFCGLPFPSLIQGLTFSDLRAPSPTVQRFDEIGVDVSKASKASKHSRLGMFAD